MNTPNDTIVAPATAAGGAIAVVRMSGPSALAICDTVFSGARRAGEAAGYTVLYGTIADGARVLDDVVVTVFRAPHWYSGEDAVEISCHGSRYIVRELLALLVRRGARMATPGEFTSRAFLGGKLDLSQAEAVADLIASGSRAAHTLATDQMRGGYSAELETLRGELLRLASLLGEEEVEFADRTELRAAMERIGAKIDRLIDSFALGNAIKEGVAVAIVGRPNVGKSTLLNRLLNEERALVSEIPGTTRDPIEATLNLDGILYRFIDTAGLRTTDDAIERMGIERAYASVARTQIVLQVFDAADPAVETLDLRPDQCRILIANKIDRMDPAAAPVSLPDAPLRPRGLGNGTAVGKTARSRRRFGARRRPDDRLQQPPLRSAAPRPHGARRRPRRSGNVTLRPARRRDPASDLPSGHHHRRNHHRRGPRSDFLEVLHRQVTACKQP